MPRKREWLQLVPEIIELVEGAPVQFWDRRTVSEVLGLGKSAAAETMREFGAGLYGKNLLLTKRELLLRLYRIAQGEECQREVTRFSKVSEALSAVRSWQRGRRKKIQHDPSVTRMENLPAGVTLEKDRLVIEFFGFEDLTRNLFEFSQILATDFDKIEKIVES